jgi:hypothetical protein
LHVPHPLQVDPGIGFLSGSEGFSFVSGYPLPDNPLVGSRPVLGSRARNGFDITADQRQELKAPTVPYSQLEFRFRTKTTNSFTSRSELISNSFGNKAIHKRAP